MNRNKSSLKMLERMEKDSRTITKTKQNLINRKKNKTNKCDGGKLLGYLNC